MGSWAMGPHGQGSGQESGLQVCVLTPPRQVCPHPEDVPTLHLSPALVHRHLGVGRLGSVNTELCEASSCAAHVGVSGNRLCITDESAPSVPHEASSDFEDSSCRRSDDSSLDGLHTDESQLEKCLDNWAFEKWFPWVVCSL